MGRVWRWLERAPCVAQGGGDAGFSG